MGKKVKALFKIFSKEKYRDDFKKGELYFNTLEFFKNLEDANESCIGDYCEGAVGFHQPDKIKIQIGTFKITDFAGPVVVHKDDLDCYNVFSLASMNDCGFNDSQKYTLAEMKKICSFSEKISSIGNYAVCIRDPNELIRRIKGAAKKQNYRLVRGLVEYYDPNVFDGNFSDIDKLFHKKNDFSYQREYRFVLKKNESKNGPIVLNIGDISNICVEMATKEINDKISIKAN